MEWNVEWNGTWNGMDHEKNTSCCKFNALCIQLKWVINLEPALLQFADVRNLVVIMAASALYKNNRVAYSW